MQTTRGEATLRDVIVIWRATCEGGEVELLERSALTCRMVFGEGWLGCDSSAQIVSQT
jgi:hypothetical protein